MSKPIISDNQMMLAIVLADKEKDHLVNRARMAMHFARVRLFMMGRLG